MGIFSKFEGRVEDTFERAANKVFDSPLSPVQIAKKAEKKMRRDKIVGAGKQYAPTLYTILVNAEDDRKLFGYYPTLAGETETYLAAKAMEEGLMMDGQPLVRFIVDDSLKHGKFDVVAELVASPIVSQLRSEEMGRYGIGPESARPGPAGQAYPLQQPGRQMLPYVPEDEIDYSIDYGEYTFDSQDFESYLQNDTFEPEDGCYDQGFDQSFDHMRGRASEPLADPAAIALGRAADPNGIGAPGGAAGLGNAAILPAAGLVSAIAAGTASAGAVITAPDTVVFVPGSGNAQPLPNPGIVKASLFNTTDNRTYDLAASRLLLGREDTNDIVVDDINASRTHAELRFEPQGVWVIADLGSTNGTLVNGEIVNSRVIRDGDYLTIGMTNFVFIQA